MEQEDSKNERIDIASGLPDWFVPWARVVKHVPVDLPGPPTVVRAVPRFLGWDLRRGGGPNRPVHVRPRAHLRDSVREADLPGRSVLALEGGSSPRRPDCARVRFRGGRDDRALTVICRAIGLMIVGVLLTIAVGCGGQSNICDSCGGSGYYRVVNHSGLVGHSPLPAEEVARIGRERLWMATHRDHVGNQVAIEGVGRIGPCITCDATGRMDG